MKKVLIGLALVCTVACSSQKNAVSDAQPANSPKVECGANKECSGAKSECCDSKAKAECTGAKTCPVTGKVQG
jgi:hypothetical protein